VVLLRCVRGVVSKAETNSIFVSRRLSGREKDQEAGEAAEGNPGNGKPG
jgi:hypothetical protein